MRRFLTLVATLSLAAAAGVALHSHASGKPGEFSPAAACSRGVLTPADAWLDDTGFQSVKAAVDEAIIGRFGGETKEDLLGPLKRGLLGLTADSSEKSVVVVVDPTLVDPDVLEGALTRAVAAEREQSPSLPALPVRVQVGCASSGDLVAAAETVIARDWHPNSAGVNMSGNFEAPDSRIHVVFDSADREIGEALQEKVGDLVDVSYGNSFFRTDRADDSQPHWAGAGISRVGEPNDCTSGFTVDTQSAGKAMVTAGHCWPNGVALHT